MPVSDMAHQVALDRIAELERENERLLLAVAEAQQQAKAHDAYAQGLERWQREAVAVILDLGGCTDQPCQCVCSRLLAEAGRSE